MGIVFFKKKSDKDFIVKNKSVDEIVYTDKEIIVRYVIDIEAANQNNLDNVKISLRNENFKTGRAAKVKKTLADKNKNYKKTTIYKDLYREIINTKSNFDEKNDEIQISANNFTSSNIKNKVVRKINKIGKIKKIDLTNAAGKLSENVTNVNAKNSAYLVGKKQQPSLNSFKKITVPVNYENSNSYLLEKNKTINVLEQEKFKIVEFKLQKESLKVDIDRKLIIDLIVDEQVIDTKNVTVNSAAPLSNNLNFQEIFIDYGFQKQTILFTGCFVKKQNRSIFRVHNKENIKRKYIVVLRPVIIPQEREVNERAKTFFLNVNPNSKSDIDISNSFNLNVSLEAKVFVSTDIGPLSNYQSFFRQIPNRQEKLERININYDVTSSGISIVGSGVPPNIEKARLVRRNLSKNELVFSPVHQFLNNEIEDILVNYDNIAGGYQFFDFNNKLVYQDYYEYAIEMLDYREKKVYSNSLFYQHLKDKEFFKFNVDFLDYNSQSSSAKFAITIDQDYFQNQTLQNMQKEAIGSDYLSKIIIGAIQDRLSNVQDINQYFNFDAYFEITNRNTGEKNTILKRIYDPNANVSLQLPNNNIYEIKVRLVPIIKSQFLRNAEIEAFEDKKFKNAFKKMMMKSKEFKKVNVDLSVVSQEITISDPKFRLIRVGQGRERRLGVLFFKILSNTGKEKSLDYFKVFLHYKETGKLEYAGKAASPLIDADLDSNTFLPISINYLLSYEAEYTGQEIDIKIKPVFDNNTESGMIDVITINTNFSTVQIFQS